MRTILKRNAYFSRRCYAAANAVEKVPNGNVADIIKRFKNKLNRLNETLVKAEDDLFKMHQSVVSERSDMINKVETAICKHGKSRLIKTGSISTQLAFDRFSDIDLCFLPEDKQFIVDFYKYPDLKHIFMQTVIEQIRHLRDIDRDLELKNDVIPLIFTRVPLLIVEFNNGVMMDIQFPNIDYHALRNTNLVRHYAAADVRFRQLYLWLRTLFIRLGVKNSKEGLLSSYHIILLVIHYLQSKTTPPVLPILSKTHEHLVGPKLSLEQLLELLEKPFDTLMDWQSENKSTVGELAIDLIDYYSNFNPYQKAISINKGLAFNRKQFVTDTKLLIYDPFSPTTTVYSNIIPDALTIVSRYIKRGQCFGDFIDSFPLFPEASDFRYSTPYKEFRYSNQ